jgi:hypothetical protein
MQFFSHPLLTLEIGDNTVSMKDHARNKKESIARKDYQWVELFGRSFPVSFFEPLMRGFVPADATAAQSTYLSTPGRRHPGAVTERQLRSGALF